MRDGKLDRLSIELLGGSQGLNSAFASTQRNADVTGLAPEARNDLKGGRHEDQN